MAEQPVFWLGSGPGKSKDKTSEAPEAERYEPALRDACKDCGYEVDDYVAAQGGFGGWLVHLERDGLQYRLFWSGKTNRLSLESAHSGGGWNKVAANDVEDEGLPVFVEAVKILLGKSNDSNNLNSREKADG